MNLSIKFPDIADVIAEDAARFRALSPEDRVRALGEMFELYSFLADRSASPTSFLRFVDEDEADGRKAIEEFVARHG